MTHLQMTFAMALILAISLSTSSRAGDVAAVTITSTVTVTGGVLLVTIQGTHPSPECGTSNNQRYAIPNSEKAMIAQVLLAQATSRTVDITGKGLCDAWTGTETAAGLVVH